MSSPINVLWGNIMQSFEQANDSSLSMHLKAVESGLLNREIDYDNVTCAAKGPHANFDTNKVYLQETYLEHLWSFIYSVFVIYEEGVQKPLSNESFSGEIEFSTEILRRAKTLYDWSISLSDQKSEWDMNLPNPKQHLNEDEKLYSEKVNGIFQKSVSYLLFHEFCHLTQGHKSYHSSFNLCNSTESESESDCDRIQMENEADDFAFNMIIDSNDNESARLVNGLSILFVTCSSLLLTRTLKGVKQKSHPDLDSRIHAALTKLDLESDESQFYCWYLCSFAVVLYLIKHDAKREQCKFDTAKEYFFSCLKQLDEIKAS